MPSVVERHVIAREHNVIRVDFNRDPDPPAPVFPGANGLCLPDTERDGADAPALMAIGIAEPAFSAAGCLNPARRRPDHSPAIRGSTNEVRDEPEVLSGGAVPWLQDHNDGQAGAPESAGHPARRDGGLSLRTMRRGDHEVLHGVRGVDEAICRRLGATSDRRSSKIERRM